MDIHAVRVGLAAAAATIPGLNTHEYTPDAVAEPCFYAAEVAIEYDQAFARGMDDVVITCVLLVSRTDDRSGQAALDGYLAGSGTGSIKAALEAARGAPGQAALGGACDDLHVVRVRNYGAYVVADTTYYGVKFDVRVIGSGDS